MSNAPCFKGCGKPRLPGHAICEDHHCRDICEKCLREDELAERMTKRRATIAEKRTRAKI